MRLPVARRVSKVIYAAMELTISKMIAIGKRRFISESTLHNLNMDLARAGAVKFGEVYALPCAEYESAA